MIIYKVINKLNGKIYIGQTKQKIEQRFLQHSQVNSPLGQAMRQFGMENFTIETIEECETQAELNEREIFWIKVLNSKKPNGYNQNDGGGGSARCPRKKFFGDDFNEKFSEKLRNLREHQELSQKEICNRLGLPSSTYSRYECGDTQPNLTSLKLLANFFDVSVDYLLDNQVFSENELIDLQSFLKDGNYTIYGKFPSDKERKKLVSMVELLFKE